MQLKQTLISKRAHSRKRCSIHSRALASCGSLNACMSCGVFFSLSVVFYLDPVPLSLWKTRNQKKNLLAGCVPFAVLSRRFRKSAGQTEAYKSLATRAEQHSFKIEWARREYTIAQQRRTSRTGLRLEKEKETQDLNYAQLLGFYGQHVPTVEKAMKKAREEGRVGVDANTGEETFTILTEKKRQNDFKSRMIEEEDCTPIENLGYSTSCCFG
eukprot:6492753-Amphidinium_carterae.3